MKFNGQINHHFVSMLCCSAQYFNTPSLSVRKLQNCSSKIKKRIVLSLPYVIPFRKFITSMVYQLRLPYPIRRFLWMINQFFLMNEYFRFIRGCSSWQMLSKGFLNKYTWNCSFSSEETKFLNDNTLGMTLTLSGCNVLSGSIYMLSGCNVLSKVQTMLFSLDAKLEGVGLPWEPASSPN